MAFRVVRQRREARRHAKLDEIFLVSQTRLVSGGWILSRIEKFHFKSPRNTNVPFTDYLLNSSLT